MITSLRKLSIKADKINSLYNSYFYSRLKNSKISYTCPSGAEFPVRKFLEIPASGALLMCQKFKNFENFGYINKKKCNCRRTKRIRGCSSLLFKRIRFVSRDY